MKTMEFANLGESKQRVLIQLSNYSMKTLRDVLRNLKAEDLK